VEDGCIHADENIVIYAAAVDDGTVANFHVIANGNIGDATWCRGRPGMNNTGIFDNSIVANPDSATVTPDYRSRPYTTVATNLYITNNISGLTDKGRISYLGRFAIETPNHAYLLTLLL
jgi:hypothetical protein